MIELEPSDPANYFVLAKIYEDGGRYEKAEGILLKAKEVRPNDSARLHAAGRLLQPPGRIRQDHQALTERASKEPNNPEAHYTIATYYWDKAYRDFRLKDPEKKDMRREGHRVGRQALEIKPDYLDAVVYKGLLLRLQANLEKDVSKQQALLKEAEALSARAKDLQKKKTAGVGN